MSAGLRVSVHAGDSTRTSSSFLSFKCCVVGDSGVGKTSMLMAYCLEDWRPNRGGFIPPTYVPSRPFIIPSADNRACITLTVKDTRGGGSDMDQLRAFDCSGADCLLICFSVTDPESYFNVESKWLPFMAATCPDATCILVGTKTDLRQQQPAQPPSRRISVLQGGADPAAGEDGGGRSSRRISVLEITSKMGAKMARKIRAFEYLECSSLEKKSLDAVFNTAIRTFTEEPDGSAASNPSAPPRDKTDAHGGEKSKKKCQIS